MRHSRAGGNPCAPNFACLAETLEFMDPRLRGDDDMRERIRFFQQPAKAERVEIRCISVLSLYAIPVYRAL